MQERVVREIRTLRAMWRELETGPVTTAPALDPTADYRPGLEKLSVSLSFSNGQ